MATLNECIGHYKNARKAVKEGKPIVAANELYEFLQIVAYAAQDAAPFDKEIFTHVFNSYLPIYHELKTRGITESVNHALCISISEVFKINNDQLPPIISTENNTQDETIVIPPIVSGGHTIDTEETDKKHNTSGEIPPIVVPTDDDTKQHAGASSSDNVAVNKSTTKSGLRPETFDDFIGQKQAVERLKTAIAVAKMDGKHCIADKGGILFKGTTGLGKTTLMRIVANELGVEFKEFNTATLQASTKSQSSFEDFIENIAKKNVPVVIGMDEIHMIPSAQETMLLTLLEDRVYKKIGNGEDIVLKMPEFTFIGATTDADKLSSAHRGRYQKGLVLELVDYTPEEWREIVIQKFSVYGLQVTEGAVKEVVGRSRSSVRDVEGYVEHIYQKARIAHITQLNEEIIKKHFADEGIEPNGLYAVDVKILEALEDARDYTLSEENLCSKVNIGIGSFREERKPFLVRIGYIESYSKGQKLIDALHNLPNREGSAGAWFYGTLNGQYKKITFKTDTILDAPLFSCITEGSKILNLSIENPVLSVQGTNGALATLSHTNLGTLENIRLNNCTVNLSGAGSKTLSVSGLVVYNFGTISHCATKIRAAFLSEGYDDGIYFSQNGQKINVRWKCQFGAIAAECIGEGLIENVVTSVTFPNGFAPLSLAPYNEEQERNLIVGYVVGYSKDFTLGNNGEKSNKGTLRDLFVLNSQNTQYACDHDYFEEGDSTFICEKTKDWDGWKSDANIDEGFPQFVFATGVNQ